MAAEDWREDLATMAEQQAYMLESGVLSDCAFQVGDQKEVFRAHKLILFRASSVFEAMFYGTLEEEGVVTITDIDPVIFKHLLKFIYTDKIEENLSIEDLTALCLAVNKYLIYYLQNICINQLCSRIRVQNVWSMLKFAELLENDTLSKAVFKVVGRNAKTLLESANLLEASHITLQSIVSQDKLNIDSEMDIINACLRWATEECERQAIPNHDDNIRKVLGDIVSHIRFLALTPSEFATGPSTQNWLSFEEKCSIFQCLDAPAGKAKLMEHLCNLKSRANYACKTLSTPNSKLFYINLPQGHFSKFETSTYSHKIKFSKDVWITSFGISCQTNNEVVLQLHPDFHILDKSQYLENIEVSIGVEKISDQMNPLGCTVSNEIIETFCYKKLASYNEFINIAMNNFKMNKDCEYVVQITEKVAGFYQLCKSFSHGTIFRDTQVDLTFLNCSNVNSVKKIRSPLYRIAFRTTKN